MTGTLNSPCYHCYGQQDSVGNLKCCRCGAILPRTWQVLQSYSENGHIAYEEIRGTYYLAGLPIVSNGDYVTQAKNIEIVAWSAGSLIVGGFDASSVARVNWVIV